MVRSLDELEIVKSLAASGMNDCAIARKTGIPRRTVRDLRCRPMIRARLSAAGSMCGIDHDFPALPPAAYGYLLGIYLGDGCRVVANDRGVKSVRYHFSNRSDDIRALFCAALDEMGIPWTRPRWFEVAVYRKAAVARLDEFVGPKA